MAMFSRDMWRISYVENLAFLTFPYTTSISLLKIVKLGLSLDIYTENTLIV